MRGPALLLDLYRAALDAAHAGRAVERSLSREVPGEGTVRVLAAGKAACAMAEGALAALGDRVEGGRVVTKEGHGRPVPGLSVREAAHPLPDRRAVAAAAEALELADRLGAGDLLLVLVSGGASALWTAPVPAVGLADQRAVTEILLGAGVEITGLNAVRKHLSRIKGGWLARHAAPARVVTLLVSDVRGDAIETVGSGPTAPDPSRFSDALGVLERTGLRSRVPDAVRRFLGEGAAGRYPETPKPGDSVFERVEHRVVARLDDALRAARESAEARGLRVRDLGTCLYGEARDEAERLARLAHAARDEGADLLLAGGEPVVRVRGTGRGGRAQELALAFARAVEGSEICGLFAATDGTDGPTDAAGALVDGQTAARARNAGMDPWDHLERNDAYPLLDRVGALLRTGPTDTNVTDLALVLVGR